MYDPDYQEIDVSLMLGSLNRYWPLRKGVSLMAGFRARGALNYRFTFHGRFRNGTLRR